MNDGDCVLRPDALTGSVASQTYAVSSTKGSESPDERCYSQQRQILIRLRPLTSWDQLETHSKAWKEVLRHSEGPTIFSTPEWLGAWWRAFAGPNRLCALAFFDPNDRIVGLAPLYLDWVETKFSSRLRRLRFVGDGTHDSDNLDLIFWRGYEEICVTALIDWLSSELEWDVCELNTLPRTSAALPFLASRLKEKGWHALTSDTPCSQIVLPDSWNAYLSQLSKKEKKRINYVSKRIRKRYTVQVDKCARLADLARGLEDLFSLHQKRWQMRGEPGTFASTQRRKLYYDIGNSFLQQGWLEFWHLRLDDKTVASQFCFRFEDRVYALQEGFDPSFSSDSVGYVLRAAVLKNLISQGVKVYDFLGGKNPVKQRWGAEIGQYINFHFARPFTRGSLYLTLQRAIRSSRSWLKTSLPSQAVYWLHRTNRKEQAIRCRDTGVKPQSIEKSHAVEWN